MRDGGVPGLERRVATELEGWIERFGPELRRHLARMLGTEADAEDVLQETWITAHQEPLATGEGADVRAWLYRVATNAALDVMARRRRRTGAVARRAPEVTGDPADAPDAVLDGLDPAARRRIREEVTRLPRKQRDAVWLRWMDGEPYAVVAERLGCSEAAARANVYQGMKRLRNRLGDLRNREIEV